MKFPRRTIVIGLTILSLLLFAAPGYADPPAPGGNAGDMVSPAALIQVTDADWAGWTQTSDCQAGWADDTWELTLTTPYLVHLKIADNFIVGDYFELFIDGVSAGTTPVVPYQGPTYSVGEFDVPLGAGVHTFTIQDIAFLTFTPEQLAGMCPAGFWFEWSLVKPLTCPEAAAIDVEKWVNGEDADEAPGPEIPVGETVTWTYQVTNNGFVPLYGVIVADDKLGTICKIPVLAPGETQTCEKTGTAIEGPYVNKAKAGATCIAPNGKKNSVKDTDVAHYLGVPDLPVCMRDNYGFAWDMIWNGATGNLAGPVYGTSPWPWDGTGSVAPPALFDTAAASTVDLMAVNPNADGCAGGFTDYFTYSGGRTVGTNDFSGSWTSYCSGNPEGSGSWTGTFTPGPCQFDGRFETSAEAGPAIAH